MGADTPSRPRQNDGRRRLAAAGAARLAQAALRQQPVRQQQRRLVRRGAESGLGVRRVQGALLVHGQPAGVLPGSEADQLGPVRVREHARAATAGRQRALGREADALRAGALDLDRDDLRIAVGADVGQQQVVERAQARCRTLRVDARAGALRRARPARAARRLPRLPSVSAQLGAPVVRPDAHALDVDRHRDAVLVVLAQPPVPEQLSLLRRAHEARRLRPHRLLEVARDRARSPAARRPARARSPGRSRETVLARVVAERHARVARDPLQLASQPERGRERDRAGGAVTQADRRHGGHDRAPRGRHVRERRGQVAADDLVDVVGPGDRHLGAERIVSRR